MHSAAAVIVMLACAATEPLRTEAALAALVTASHLPVQEGQETLEREGAAGTCHHSAVEAIGPEAPCGCDEGCRWNYASAPFCVGSARAGPWDDGTSRYALTHRRDDPEAPVPPPSFAEAEIALHATMVAESEPPECTSDEYASFGNQRWTGEAYVDGAYHTFVADKEWFWGGDVWSVALDGEPAVVWELESSTR